MRKSQSLKSLATKSDKATKRQSKKLKRHKGQSKKTIKAPNSDVRNDREMVARMKAKRKGNGSRKESTIAEDKLKSST